MKLGAEPKKLVALVALLVVAGITYYVMSADEPAAPVRTPTQTQSAPPTVARTVPAARNRSSDRNNNRSQVKELKLSLGSRDPKDRPDPASIDPTLRLDLLAKVQNIEVGPPGRNLFQFGSAPPPPAPPQKLPKVDQIAINRTPPPPPPTTDTLPPPKPTAPPMTFKYYGYKVSKSDGRKAAFLLDGEDILIAGENDTVKKHYRVVKIGISSITIEDTEFKSTQTLPLQENLAG